VVQLVVGIPGGRGRRPRMFKGAPINARFAVGYRCGGKQPVAP
jgi:hypothetical protein